MADVVTDAYLGRGQSPEPLPLRVLFTAFLNIWGCPDLVDT